MLEGPLEYWFEACRQTRVSPFSRVTPWMQFTGLLDKNGKEIYEGDVVRGSNSYDMEVFWMETSACFGIFWLAGNLACEDTLQNHMAEHFEVIGNIYENPELKS